MTEVATGVTYKIMAFPGCGQIGVARRFPNGKVWAARADLLKARDKGSLVASLEKRLDNYARKQGWIK